MSEICQSLMSRIYGDNIWDGFVPSEVPADVQGWNGTHFSLSRVLPSKKQQIIVDVGVWKGQSTITLANNLRKNSIDGVVIAVDTFLGSFEHWRQHGRLFNRKNGVPDLYRTFLSNVERAGLCEYVIPMPQTSSTACKILKSFNVRPTIVHVDAAHEYREALMDIEDYWEILDEEGYLIGDDYHQTWPGIVRAAGEFSARVCKPLAIEPPKFIIRK